MNNGDILIIDDEVQIRKLLSITLGSHDYRVAEAATAREGVALAANHPPDLILLDIGLPDMNGQDVLKLLRLWFTKPIIMLTVQSDEENIVNALDHGANDYLVKPFRTGELLARIRTVLRNNGADSEPAVISCGDIQIDLAARLVRNSGKPVKLTATEYTLLALLAKNDGKVLTHQFLLREVWGPAYTNQSQYLRVYIAQLRKKLENDPNRPEIIHTESGIGYRFVIPG